MLYKIHTFTYERPKHSIYLSYVFLIIVRSRKIRKTVHKISMLLIHLNKCHHFSPSNFVISHFALNSELKKRNLFLMLIAISLQMPTCQPTTTAKNIYIREYKYSIFFSISRTNNNNHNYVSNVFRLRFILLDITQLNIYTYIYG